ncbi:hypothetical protein CTAYLR_008515 [Chrysophaeum taylorii]|uniref:Sulfate transporter n=1 Tax=Chrysophaeum taylorii TaxID=2483200 RepID=A0AAD7XJV6_9STRA|nr:hypothetical protein CTAYLR_008515 [Chrysophaeum taylorii]
MGSAGFFFGVVRTEGVAAVYGVVNAVLSVPSLYGYSSIIFKAPAFRQMSSALAKLVVLSSAVHQVCFSLWSSLPFAIGQVQDAGLIFLSKIATRVADEVEARGGSEADALSTALFALAAATATLGGALVVFGRTRLTFCVSYLPTPVLAGYLAFIGLFCCEAGLTLCVGAPIEGPATWHRLWSPRRNLLLSFPAVASGLFLQQVSRRYGSNDLALPLAMIAIVLVFYGVVAATPSYALGDARRDGWLSEPQPGVGVGEALSLYARGRVVWSVALRSVAASWLGMVLVVAFSSCLDVAAVEVDLGKALNMDQELTTVGASNVVAGLAGGFTGSYIFSQTIFTCRAGCRSRVAGWCVVVAELAVVCAPTDLSAQLPLYFFAATLFLVGIDLLVEWLWEVRDRYASTSEYASSLFTFCAVQAFGLDTGLLLGLVSSALVFLAAAADIGENLQPLTRVAPVTTSRKKPSEARALERLKDRLVVLELRGQLWWGTAASMFSRIRTALQLDDDDDDHHYQDENQSWLRRRFSSRESRSSSESSSLLRKSSRRRRDARRESWHLVLDLRRVDGIDASAARSLFLPLFQLARAGKCSLALAALAPSHARLLRRHGAVADADDFDRVASFLALDDALEWAQSRQLAMAGLARPKSSDNLRPASFREIKRTYEPPPPPEQKKLLPAATNLSSSVPVGGLPRPPQATSWLEDDCLSLGAARFVARSVLRVDHKFEALAVSTLRRFCPREVRAERTQRLFDAGDDATSFFVVLTGSVSLVQARIDLETGTAATSSRDTEGAARPGSFFGFVDAFADVGRPPTRTLSAVARESSAVAMFLVSDLDAIFLHSPEVLAAIHRALLHQASRELLNA